MFRRVLRWTLQTEQSISFRLYSQKNTASMLDVKYQQGLINRAQVEDYEYDRAIDNDFHSGVRISAYSKVTFRNILFFKKLYQISLYSDYVCILLQDGFRLNNSVFAFGPIIVLPKTVFSWNIGSINQISSDSLCMIPMIDPKISLLIIGVGEVSKVSKEIGARILETIQREKMNIEILSTHMACAQFNHLSGLGKMVAAALIPPDNVDQDPDHVFNTRSIEGKLFSLENFATDEVKEFNRNRKDIRRRFLKLTEKK